MVSFLFGFQNSEFCLLYILVLLYSIVILLVKIFNFVPHVFKTFASCPMNHYIYYTESIGIMSLEAFVSIISILSFQK